MPLRLFFVLQSCGEYLIFFLMLEIYVQPAYFYSHCELASHLEPVGGDEEGVGD